jgi:predicted benzoate:H+ symporter BenE
VDTSLDTAYLFNERIVLFHYTNVAGVAYVLRHQFESQPLSWLAAIPFVFALLTDIDNVVFASLNLTRVNYGAWVAFLVVACAALFATVCASVWFLSIKVSKRRV